jgi:hypothetical protein
MRNLVQYPVKADEAISALQLALESYTKSVRSHGIGNIDGISLLMAEQFITENKEAFDKFTKGKLSV